MKPGWKTTEFWMALLTNLFNMMLSMGALPANFPQDAMVSTIAGVGGAVALIAYIVSRGWLKAKTP